MSFEEINPAYTLHSPFGATLRLVSFEGTESLCDLFTFNLSLVAEDHNLTFDKVVGEHVSVAVDLNDGKERFIDGLITDFTYAGVGPGGAMYRATLRPWLWRLTLTSDCRIFQNQNPAEICSAIFRQHGFADFELRLKSQPPPREYCVQYMETAFHFVSRLIEDAGLFYFFRFERGKHTLVISDDPTVFAPCTGIDLLKYRPAGHRSTRADSLQDCTLVGRMTSDGLGLGDFNFESPDDALVVSEGARNGLSHFRYPGGFATKNEGRDLAKRAHQVNLQSAEMLQASAVSAGIQAGHCLTLENHPRKALNRRYVIRSVTHTGGKKEYTNAFTAFPQSLPFRAPPRTPKPRIHGAQTAVVVGKSGEEIWTDRHGRVKVQFHWDRRGKRDENSSCWVRVAQGWAGKQYGSFFLPRIGQEVVVCFLDGDPDRPLVTGAVHNASQTVPLNLPSERTRSTTRSSTVKGKGFNEIRVEDKKGDEELYFHAQKDLNSHVRNNQTETIQNHHEVLVEKGDQRFEVAKGNHTLAVPKGLQTERVKQRDIVVETRENHQTKGDFQHRVGGSYTLKIDGNLSIEASGSITLKAAGNLKTTSGRSTSIEAAADLKQQAGTKLSQKAGVGLTSQAGTTMELKAGAMLKAKASAMTSVEAGGMLTLKGGLVKIN
ncbi:Type VI secretion system tip protein VgrG [Sulfidibacter corallicola]|uniref:Type VI secretion system tip protein VgrG n=1 Tax=Sulfidibacter corallicola TaxID=2818388 RepID=A0A8A4TLY4_SULCO|nr:type VI secretion system tip protein TssI/VgrG [Sulfidibacter corallicola]QTD50966.1 type VI secretion system tip protein VgrG [Sulfidibacter corallicola]